MKLLLLLLPWLGLTLVYGHAEEASSVGGNLNVEKISGDWFSIVLASDRREKIEENGSMRVFVQHINASENSIAFKFHTVENGQCTKNFLVAVKTAKPGVYYIEYDGRNTFTIDRTDYDNYIIFLVVNVKDGETFQLMELFGREQNLSSDIKEKFAQLCEECGITRNNIIDLTTTDRGLQARD